MSVRQRVAYAKEDIDEAKEIDRFRLAENLLLVIGANLLRQSPSANETHGIKRRRAIRSRPQIVNRYDARMFELSGNLCLTEEAPGEGGMVRALGAQFLQGHVASET